MFMQPSAELGLIVCMVADQVLCPRRQAGVLCPTSTAWSSSCEAALASHQGSSAGVASPLRDLGAQCKLHALPGQPSTALAR